MTGRPAFFTIGAPSRRGLCRSSEVTALRQEANQLCRAARETIASLTEAQGRPIRGRDRE